MSGSEQAPLSNGDRNSTETDGEEEVSPVASLDNYAVTNVEIRQLNLEGSPRLTGEDLEHVRLLAAAPNTLPPIMIRRDTMQVIDGRHRIRAALLKGQTQIAARQIDCDDHAAFVLAVKENVAHGLPLTLADRRAAAVSIIASCPHWSDRVVAECTGLSDKTVSVLRAVGNPTESPESTSRLGKDGRLRPLNTAAMRQQAAAMLRAQPNAGLREIARSTGLSPATVMDVRKRIVRGEDPVPMRYGATRGPDAEGKTRRAPRRVRQARPVNPTELLAELMNDPSLKYSKTGRRVVRWLYRYTVNPENCQWLAKSIPDRWAMPIVDLARNCAAAWIKLAEVLEDRSLDGHDPRDLVDSETPPPSALALAQVPEVR